jgi:hypothetical protein
LRGLGCAQLVLFWGDGGSARQVCQSIYHRAQMKLVTVCNDRLTMDPQYVPGKCNIGRKGRAIRLSTGLVLIALSVVLGVTLATRLFWAFRLGLFLPIYIGLLAALEGSMSFCVLHAARGTYDFNEPMGFASKRSKTMKTIVSEDQKRLDRRKALKMHSEAVVGAVLLTLLLALA